MRLKDRVALITGGAGGLGRAMAELFAKEGAKVIALDLRESKKQLQGVDFLLLDVTDPSSCKEMFEKVLNDYGRIDVLVNNAGITRDALTHKMTDEAWQEVLDVNLTGVFNLTRLVGPQMMKQGKGSIINISSVVGTFGNIGQINYAATKSGVVSMAKTWAKEFSRKGAAVRVNAIAPGYIMTDILKTVPQELLDSFASMTMLGRLGQPEELAYAALFLASDESSYVTGQLLGVDGGMRL